MAHTTAVSKFVAAHGKAHTIHVQVLSPRPDSRGGTYMHCQDVAEFLRAWGKRRPAGVTEWLGQFAPARPGTVIQVKAMAADYSTIAALELPYAG
jgi:hypothetical protein